MIQGDADDSYSDEDSQYEANRAMGFLTLVREARARRSAIPVPKRKESEALAHDALAAPTEQAEYDLLLHAVAVDPCNADALLHLKDHFELTLEEDLEATQGIAELAERRLGKKGFKACEGHFWSYLETRPYMQARAECADLLLESGQVDAALDAYAALLALNPADDQGNRFLLLATCLKHGRLDQAAALLESRPEDVAQNALFAWCRTLERLLAGDGAGAETALASARKVNGFCEAYILGHRQCPKDPQAFFQPGSRDEAAYYALTLREAWDPHTDAIKWLFAQPRPSR